jgi:NTE family protein
MRRAATRCAPRPAKAAPPQLATQVFPERQFEQERVKDIQFQSKNRFSHAQIRQIEAVRSALADMIARLPARMRSDPQVQKLSEISQRGPVSLLHRVNRHDTKSSDFKDCGFSRATVDELWLAGHNDVQRVV